MHGLLLSLGRPILQLLRILRPRILDILFTYSQSHPYASQNHSPMNESYPHSTASAAQ